MKTSIIVAIGKNREIGCNNQLLWHLPEDLKNFKRITKGHHILMGRKTFESIGKPLPNRTTIILTRDKNYHVEGCYTVHSLEDGVKLAESRGEDELLICGGANVYAQAVEVANRIYLTEVDWEGEADTYFPDFDRSKWEIVETKTMPLSEKNPLAWEMNIFERK